jgi:hypothetical protein
MVIRHVMKIQIVSLERILIVILVHARVINPTNGIQLLLPVIVLLHIIMNQKEEPVVILFI